VTRKLPVSCAFSKLLQQEGIVFHELEKPVNKKVLLLILLFLG
jgi:hypothetical protein